MEMTTKARRRATKDLASYLRELANAGYLHDVFAEKRGSTYWGKSYPGWTKTGQAAIDAIGKDGVTVSFDLEGTHYSVYFADLDVIGDRDEGPALLERFKAFVEEMKDAGEYYVPGTKVPYWALPWWDGVNVVCDEDNNRFVADSERVIAPLGTKDENGYYLVSDAASGDVYVLWDRYSAVWGSAVVPAGKPVKTYKSYILVGNDEVVLRDSDFRDVVQNAPDIGNREVEKIDFEKNEAGEWFYVRFWAPDEEKLALYEAHGFYWKAESLRRRIAEAEAEEQRSEQGKSQRLSDLDAFVKASNKVLISVFFQVNDGLDMADHANIYDAERHLRGLYDAEKSLICHRLYGVQVKGWRGRAEQGMLINIPAARAALKNGVLHLAVPSSVMGKVIGRGGETIRATKEALRKKGLSGLKDIKLHAE